jgi:hypothetical protein
MKKRGFMDKLEERMRDLEVARRIYFELGGDEEEPARTLHRRTMALDTAPGGSGKPLLIVSRNKAEEGEASRVAKYGKKRPVPYVKDGRTPRFFTLVREWFAKHPGHAANSGRMMKELGASTKGEKQAIYNALSTMKLKGELQRDEASGAYSVPRRP